MLCSAPCTLYSKKFLQNQNRQKKPGMHTCYGLSLSIQEQGLRLKLQQGRRWRAKSWRSTCWWRRTGCRQGQSSRRRCRSGLRGLRTRFVLWGPRGTGKSTLARKFAAGLVEREGAAWSSVRLVFVLSGSSMSQSYAGLLGESCMRAGRGEILKRAISSSSSNRVPCLGQHRRLQTTRVRPSDAALQGGRVPCSAEVM